MALWYSLLTGVILLHISSSKKCSVDICVKTQPWPSAGTDEYVYVKLFCNNGKETPWIFIDDPKADDFESDELKCYSIEGLREYMETDEIVKVGVKLMGSRNAKSAWDFDYIAVLYRCQCRSYRFYTSINVDDPPEYRNYKGNCTIKQRISSESMTVPDAVMIKLKDMRTD